MYKCKIIADSINPSGDRITTFLVRYPRIIHAELMTHRMFSRNSASSRAIPFEKMVKMAEEDPFIPIAWQTDHKGMQGNTYIQGFDPWSQKNSEERLKDFWLEARNDAVRHAKFLNSNALTKQLCNRLLEPFMWHTVLVTATEWENFFELRCPKYTGKFATWRSWKDMLTEAKEDKTLNKEALESLINSSITQKLMTSESNAEIHIQVLAETMWDAMNESIPKELKAGEWHIPFGDKTNDGELAESISPGEALIYKGLTLSNLRLKVATARCARLSYMTFDGEIDYEKDIRLHDYLLENKHMSPFEHCARAMSHEEYGEFYKGKLVNQEFTFEKSYKANYLIGSGNEEDSGWCNNLKGFIPYRYLIENHDK